MYPTVVPPQEDSCTSCSKCYKYYLSLWILTWLVTRVGCEADGNMQLPATCRKGMSAEDQVSNGSRHPKAGTKVPWGLGNVHAINAYLWKSTTAHGGQLYESIAVDPCPSMVLFFVLVFSGEDHLRVLFHWLLLLDLHGMTVHAKTVGCSLREAQTEFDTELGVLHLFEQAAGRNHALPTAGGGTSLSAWSFSLI